MLSTVALLNGDAILNACHVLFRNNITTTQNNDKLSTHFRCRWRMDLDSDSIDTPILLYSIRVQNRFFLSDVYDIVSFLLEHNVFYFCADIV